MIHSIETALPPPQREGRGGATPIGAPVPARWHHWMAIVACLGIFGVAALLEPTPVGGSGLRAAGVRLPETCLFFQATGIPCPGCGLTRSCVAAVHGRFADSFAFHKLGWAVLLYALIQALRHTLWLARPAGRPWVDRWGSRLDYGLIFLPVGMLLLWLPTFAHLAWHRLGG